MWTKGFIASLLFFVCSANEHERRWMQELLTKKNNPTAGMHNKQWETDPLTQSFQTNAIQRHGNANQEAHAIHSHRLSSLAERICWEDGVSCEADTTCVNCCNGTSTSIYFGTVCGSSSCLEDGTVCLDGDTWNCYNCCSPPYGGNTCGGECTEAGTLCDYETTCMGCCNYTFYSIGNGDYQCGCKEDGESCIPGQDCYSCCNGAYDNDGTTCGGTCIPDATACTVGVDCHLCCTYSTFWYSTGQNQCGFEKCYEDGESCIPGVSCSMCCSGGAYDGDGTVCGGECIPTGTECSYISSCNKCCTDYQNWYGGFWPFPTNTTTSSEISSSPSLSISPTSSPSYENNFYMYFGGTSHWNYTSGSMICGGEACWANGTSCSPGNTCNKCCHQAIANGGNECGGDCLPAGTTCNYHSTCRACCNYNYMYDEALQSYTCASYEDMFSEYNSTTTSTTVGGPF
jgi:hypothetical protein